MQPERLSEKARYAGCDSPNSGYKMKPLKNLKRVLASIFFILASVGSNAEVTALEWQTDALLAAATNRNVEGDDPAANTGTSVPTSRLGMYCQISAKYAVISDTQQAVDKAGRSNEMSYQIAKRLGELKRKQHCAVFA